MMRRLAYLVVLAALAVAVIGVQLDRQAYRDLWAASVTPPPFRGVSLQRQLEFAAQSGAEMPLDQAQGLVRKRPVPARHLLLLATAAETAGEREVALAALEVSATRGWREPGPQLAVAQAGILSGDYATAAPRLAALSATGGAPDQTTLLLAAMMAEEGGREALADLLTGEGSWKRLFVQRLRATGDIGDFTDTIAMAWDRGAELNCDQLRPAALSLLRAGQADEAARIWQGPCAREQLAAN